jgi:TonB family protein
MSDPDLNQPTSKRLWVIAALTAFGLHLGGVALAVAHLRADDGDEGLGAAGAEYAVELASPKLPDEEALPPGNDIAQQAVQGAVQQKAELKDTDLPQARPMDAEDPDRIVTEDNSKKPKEEDTQVAKVETNAQEMQEAHEDRAPTQIEDAPREAETAKAPNPGIGKDKLGLTAKWGKKISAYFELHKKYPEKKKDAKEAKVKVSLVLNRRGNVLSVDVTESSGDPDYDEAAVAMVRRSDPVPQPPAELMNDQFPFNLEVKFNKPKK